MRNAFKVKIKNFLEKLLLKQTKMKVITKKLQIFLGNIYLDFLVSFILNIFLSYEQKMDYEELSKRVNKSKSPFKTCLKSKSKGSKLRIRSSKNKSPKSNQSISRGKIFSAIV